MRSLLVIVLQELFIGKIQRPFAEEDHSPYELGLERQDNSLDVGIQVWRVEAGLIERHSISASRET